MGVTIRSKRTGETLDGIWSWEDFVTISEGKRFAKWWNRLVTRLGMPELMVGEVCVGRMSGREGGPISCLK
jgi:hypothetical protein